MAELQKGVLMKAKRAEGISTIMGTDGPTAVFIAGKADKKHKFSFKQRLHKLQYSIRKSIALKSVKAGTHTMDEVADYIVNELGYT